MILFETNRLLVRKFTAGDADGFFRLNSDTEVMRYIRPVKSREECDSFLSENINFYQDHSCLGRFAVEEKEPVKFIGSFSVLYLEGEADFHIGYALLPSSWGKGYATELLEAGLTYFFTQTDKKEVFAITEPGNTASQKVILKSGFSKKGQRMEDDKQLDLFFISREQHLAKGL